MLGSFGFIHKLGKVYFGKVISIHSNSIRINGIEVNTKKIDIYNLPSDFLKKVKGNSITIRVDGPYDFFKY